MAVDSLYLPPEWSDDQNMSVMFAPFRDRSLNPKSWDRKMKFWIHIISEDCRQNNRFVIDIKELSNRFIRNGKKPGCLDVVVEEMKRSGRLKMASHYERAAGARDWMGWGLTTFVWTPVQWSLCALWGKGKSGDHQEPMVLQDLLKETSVRLLEQHYDNVVHESTDNLVELDTLRSRHASLCTSDREFDLVLQQLQLDKKVTVTITKEKDIVVKFCKKGDNYVSTISDLELNIFRIQKVMNNLEKQTELLSHQCDQYVDEARSLVKDGKRTQALHPLRKKKRVETTLRRKMMSVDQLHNMISKIQDAASNEMILKAYESGLSVITSLNQDTPVDQVENTLDKLQDALEDQGEVTTMLAQDPGDISQDDLEKELADLLAADRHATAEDDDSLAGLLEGLHVTGTVPDMPEVPTFSPSTSHRISPKRETTQPSAPAMTH